MNTAARLEGANKAFGTRVCFSGACYDAAKRHLSGPLSTRRVGDVLLKGKTEPISVTALASDHDAVWLETYAEAYNALAVCAQDAQTKFTDLGDDPLVALHLDRLSRGGTGTVFELTEK